MEEKLSLMNEIRRLEESISTCYERVYVLKAKLKSKNITESEKETLQKELVEVEKLLATNKSLIKKVHKGNRTTFYASLAICLLIFIVWMLYNLTYGDKW